MRLLWIRHGETLWNREFRLQGVSDVELSEKGMEQARRLARDLREEPVRLFVSPLLRTRSFAAPLAERFSLSPVILADLREMSFGRWEGLRYEDMDETLQQSFAEWCRNPVDVCPPGGEPFSAVTDRAQAALRVITMQMRQGETAAVVTHGGIIRAVVTMLMEMPPAGAGRLSIEPASVTVMDCPAGQWHLVRLNDTGHLRDDC
jgi:phosphoserine phosphatase